jgi:DNA-binding beta-propeller fold protein YncE
VDQELVRGSAHAGAGAGREVESAGSTPALPQNAAPPGGEVAVCTGALQTAHVATPTTVLVAGGGTGADAVPATQARLVEPFAVARDRRGNLYIAEMAASRVRKVDPSGFMTTVAGLGTRGNSGDGGPGSAAQLAGPHHLAFPPDGRLLYIADTFNNRVRVLDLDSGVIRGAVGSGQQGFGGDGGPAAAARLRDVFCIDFDRAGRRLFVIDLGNRRVRAVDLSTGTISTVAGNGDKGVPADGADAVCAPLFDPRALAVDSRGQLYILERNGHALRVVTTAGKIRTVAGTGQRGNAGDGGPARQALLDGPKHLAVDRDDSVLIVDTENHTVRRYTPADGRITRVAGTGAAGSAGLGGPPHRLELDRPHGVYVDGNGDLYLSDSGNHRVVKLVR